MRDKYNEPEQDVLLVFMNKADGCEPTYVFRLMEAEGVFHTVIDADGNRRRPCQAKTSEDGMAPDLGPCTKTCGPKVCIDRERPPRS